ncbi:MAG: hypothetical protein OS112_05030 [Methanoregula sp.]|nr:MAG: hypothetical protein OS112_05030 [Methanoregula sp.]
METIEKRVSERCSCALVMRREASAEPSKSEEVYRNLDDTKGGISRPSNKDVAAPDQIASGMAGTGQENEELEWARSHVPPDPYLAERKTEIIGWGIKPRTKVWQKPSGTSPDEETGTTPDKPGMSILILAERQDRITEFLSKKIKRLDRRITLLEERGRS